MQRTLDRPRALAASSSDCSASLFLSRQVTWRIVSMPFSNKSRATPIGAMVMLEPAESVRLKALTMSRSLSAFL